MNDVEAQITEWRTFVANAPAVNGHDVDELEAHLRDQIADLDAGRADRRRSVPRGGEADGRGRHALHRVRSASTAPGCGSNSYLLIYGEAVFGAGVNGLARSDQCSRSTAAVVIQVARLAAGFPDHPSRPGSHGTSVCSCCRSSPHTSRTAADFWTNAAMDPDGNAIRACSARRQPVSVRFRLGHRAARRAPIFPVHAVVRDRLSRT